MYKVFLLFLLLGILTACSNAGSGGTDIPGYPAIADNTQDKKISSKIENVTDSMSRINFTIQAISAQEYRSLKANPCDFQLALPDSVEYSRMMKRDASFVKIIDSNIIIKAGKKVDTFTTITVGDPYYTDTVIYEGKLKCLNYAIIYECMAEGMKLGTSLVNLSTGEILNARCDFAFSPSGKLLLSYQDRPIWQSGYEFTLFINDKGILKPIADTMFGKMMARECKWLNEKEFYVKQYNPKGDTSYIKIKLSGKEF